VVGAGPRSGAGISCALPGQSFVAAPLIA
jgi:hypothetical protein